MQNCIICTSETNFSTKCGCSFCLVCLIDWFEEKNRDKPVQLLKCPNQVCTFNYTRNDILQYCSNQPYERMIQEILLKEYLKNIDVRPCPNGKCKYFGYIELENKCDEELECLECGMKWRDFALASYTFQTEYMIKNLFGVIREFFYCFITANECPNCGVLIQRNGGCKHMTCKVCAHQFCWYCKTQWGKHKDIQCLGQQTIFIGLLSTFPINILNQFGIFYYVLYAFYPLLWIFELITMNVLIIGTSVGIFGCFRQIMTLKINGRYDIYETLLVLAGSMLLLFVEYWVYLFTTTFLDITLWKFFIGFGMEISIGVLILSYLTRIGWRWILTPLICVFLFYQWGLNGLPMFIWLIPVIFSQGYFISQISFNVIALGLLVLFNIFSLTQLFSQLPVYLILGSTCFYFNKNSARGKFIFVGILILTYFYELIFA